MTPRILIAENSIVAGAMLTAQIERKEPDYQIRLRKSLAGTREEFPAAMGA